MYNDVRKEQDMLAINASARPTRLMGYLELRTLRGVTCGRTDSTDFSTRRIPLTEGVTPLQGAASPLVPVRFDKLDADVSSWVVPFGPIGVSSPRLIIWTEATSGCALLEATLPLAPFSGFPLPFNVLPPSEDMGITFCFLIVRSTSPRVGDPFLRFSVRYLSFLALEPKRLLYQEE